MRIKSVLIKNFRGIADGTAPFEFDNFNLIIGNNGTSKTAVLEAINLCLSSSYAAARLSIKDFHMGKDEQIEIAVFFDENFDVDVPDFFANKQKIECNGICLLGKKRDRSAPGKAFNDLVVAQHFYLPVKSRDKDGWVITRGTGSEFKITERHLSVSFATAIYPKSFYFGKNRDRQLQKGYNTSMSNVIDDLNWRFEKGQRSKSDEEKFKHKKEEVEHYIFDNTDGDTLGKTIDETNIVLKDLDLPEVNISLIKTLTPYDGSEIVKKFDGFELPVNLIGSGLEMITSLIFLETLARISKSEICIIVDEPELHLHPILQNKLAEHLQEVSSESQVIISSHSPFFFKNCFHKAGTKVLISAVENTQTILKDSKNIDFGLFKWSPSWGEINYFAYGLPTIEFHDELYGALHEKYISLALSESDAEKRSSLKKFDIEVLALYNPKNQLKKWSELRKNKQETPYQVTISTFIRNKVHHPESVQTDKYDDGDLMSSVRHMISLLKKA